MPGSSQSVVLPLRTEEGPRHSLKRRLLMTVATIAIVQLLYWFGVYPLLFSAGPRPAAIPIRDFAVATLPAPTLEALRTAAFRPVQLPHTESDGPGYRALRFWIDLESIPERGLDLVPIVAIDNVMVVLNGSIVRLDGRMERPGATYHGNNRSITFVPAGLLKPGANEFVLVTVRQFVPYFDFYRPLIGASEQVRPLLVKRAYLLSGYQLQSIAVGVVISVMALVLLLRATQRAYALWLFLLVLAWTLRGIYYRWADPPFDPGQRMVAYFVLTTFLPVAWANFANEWTGRAWRWIAPATLLAWSGFVAYCAFALLVGRDPASFDTCSTLANAFGIAVGGIALFRFLWHLVRVPDERYWEVALFALILALMVIEFVYQWWFESSTGHVQNSLPFLILAFVAAFLSRNVRLFRSMNEINTLLKEQLAAREAELAVQYARQGELMRRETLLEERRRLMGEMHDGIGGQLVSLLHANRHQALTHEELTEALAGVTDELRLVIDSLDTVGSAVGTALANYRRRIEPRLKAAGIELAWRNDLEEDPEGFGPQEVLHVCRIVQEAVTNALKHAGATRIGIALATEGTPAELVVTVTDNGRGFDAAASGSGQHGQRTMRERATAIRGSVDVTSGPGGTQVTLRVPLPRIMS